MSLTYGSTVGAVLQSASNGSWANAYEYHLDQLDSNDYAHWEAYYMSPPHSVPNQKIDDHHGFRIYFDASNSTHMLYVEGSDNSSEPYYVTTSGAGTATTHSVAISPGDVVWMGASSGFSSPKFVFTVTHEHLWHSVTPWNLPSVDATSTWPSQYEYRWRTSGSGTEIFGLWHHVNKVWDSANHDIQVDTNSDTWQDSGSSHPDTVSAPNNGVITISSSGFPNLYKFNKPTTASWISSGGSGSGSGSGGGINTLSGGSSPEIKDITFTNASDTIVYLAFNWQNVSTAYLFVDRGGTVTQTNISLGGLGQSGSVGSSGFLTNMQDGDKVWIANTELVDNPHIHRFIDWSYDKATGKVIAKAFFIDDGGNGFNQNADVALARIFGATYNHGYSLYEAQQDPTGGFTDHDGTLKTLTLDAPPGSRWAITRGNTHQYGTGFKVPSANRKVFSNFW